MEKFSQIAIRYLIHIILEKRKLEQKQPPIPLDKKHILTPTQTNDIHIIVQTSTNGPLMKIVTKPPRTCVGDGEQNIAHLCMQIRMLLFFSFQEWTTLKMGTVILVKKPTYQDHIVHGISRWRSISQSKLQIVQDFKTCKPILARTSYVSLIATDKQVAKHTSRAT